ncbi:MAG: hypothetical protein PHQ41_08230 [Candidatus Cloacimonetes bacterium]|nr:hypothetical protein [Candidatus Cloacimonadota bacterium]
MPKFMLSSEEINSNGGFSFVKKLLDGNVRMKDWDAELPAARNSWSIKCQNFFFSTFLTTQPYHRFKAYIFSFLSQKTADFSLFC